MYGGALCAQYVDYLWKSQCCKAFASSTQICEASGHKAPCYFIGNMDGYSGKFCYFFKEFKQQVISTIDEIYIVHNSIFS